MISGDFPGRDSDLAKEGPVENLYGHPEKRRGEHARRGADRGIGQNRSPRTWSSVFGTSARASRRRIKSSSSPGFFHTQDTNLYSTRVPYDFNAGGSGADLPPRQGILGKARLSHRFRKHEVQPHPRGFRPVPPAASPSAGRGDGTPSCGDSGSVFRLKLPIG